MPLLTSDEKEKLITQLKGKYKGCPLCGSFGTGAIIGDVVSLSVLERGVPSGVVPGPQLIPTIPVICNSCGHTTLFAAGQYISIKD
jgi:hypothetical protein